MPKTTKVYATAGRSILVPMMKHAIIELTKLADTNGFGDNPIVGHAKGIINEIDFVMAEAPAFVPHEEVQAMYRSGMSYLDISAQTGMTTDTISRILKAGGLKAHKAGSRKYDPYPERTADIIAMHNEGATLEKIGAKYKITRERVRQILKKNKIDTSLESRPLDAKQLAAVEEYVSGKSLIHVAEKHGVGTHSLKNWILKSGHEVRPGARTRRIKEEMLEKAKRAAEMYRSGMTTREIGVALGYSNRQNAAAGTVYRLLAIAGVKPSRTRRSARRYGTRVRGRPVSDDTEKRRQC